MRFCFTSSISIGSKRGHCRLHFGVTLRSSALEGFSNISFQNCCSVSGGHLEPPSSCHWPDRTDLAQRDLFELQSFCVQAKRAFRCALLWVGSFGFDCVGGLYCALGNLASHVAKSQLTSTTFCSVHWPGVTVLTKQGSIPRLSSKDLI